MIDMLCRWMYHYINGVWYQEWIQEFGGMDLFWWLRH